MRYILGISNQQKTVLDDILVKYCFYREERKVKKCTVIEELLACSLNENNE